MVRSATSRGLVVSIAAAVVLAACGLEDIVDASGSAPVRIGDNFFQPETLSVARGTVVRWTNQGAAQHQVVSVGGSWASNTLSNGWWFEVRFDSAGTFAYRCLLDSTHTETGTIVVQ